MKMAGLVVDAVMRLVSWYAASTPEELMDLTGTATPEEALTAIEEHLARAAVQLIFAPPEL